MLPQREQVLLAQIHAVQQDLPRGHVVEAHEKAYKRSLARARMSHNSHCLPCFNGERHILEDPLDAAQRGKFGAGRLGNASPDNRLLLRLVQLLIGEPDMPEFDPV